MDSTAELLKELRQRGFDARLDETGVVTVWIDPDRDAYAAKTQRRKKPRAAAVDNEQLPGQMDIFDFLGGK